MIASSYQKRKKDVLEALDKNKMAKEAGCKTMNGLGMMLFQGAAAFKLWTGQDMPIEHMKEVLNIRYDD